MAYLLDTDTFIYAKNFNYGFDFCPAYWDFLLRENQAGEIFSVQKVQKELCPNDKNQQDELARWVQQEGASLFIPFDQKTSIQTVQVSNYINSLSTPPVLQQNKDSFLNGADLILVACAKAYNHVVVTREIFVNIDPNLTKVKIPNVCEYFGVTCATPFQMLRSLGARFVLSTKEMQSDVDMDYDDSQDEDIEFSLSEDENDYEV